VLFRAKLKPFYSDHCYACSFGRRAAATCAQRPCDDHALTL
jgi:hypothetical protein